MNFNIKLLSSKKALLQLMDSGTVVKFEINGISEDYKKNIIHQNSIAVILSMDCLLKEEKEGAMEFANLLKRRPK